MFTDLRKIDPRDLCLGSEAKGIGVNLNQANNLIQYDGKRFLKLISELSYRMSTAGFLKLDRLTICGLRQRGNWVELAEK